MLPLKGVFRRWSSLEMDVVFPVRRTLNQKENQEIKGPKVWIQLGIKVFSVA